MAGATAWIHRTKTQCGVFRMGPFGIGSTAAGWWFSMTGGAAGMYSLDIRTMTGGAVAASSRYTRLQVRNGCMAEAAITTMGYINRSIFGSTRIMTISTGGHTESHISESNMVDTAVSRRLIRMTV
jgi:hypothetical protein